MEPVNSGVVTGLQPFSTPLYVEDLPKAATPACLSGARKAPWTNRVPQHEPWPRVLKGDTPAKNEISDEYKRNVHHEDQYDNKTSPEGLKPIGVVEGDETIERGMFWRR